PGYGDRPDGDRVPDPRRRAGPCPGGLANGGTAMSTGPLLDIRGLTVSVGPEANPVRLVEGVDLTVNAGETLGVVGESGSGKSITCLAVMGLLPSGARVSDGSITFDGEDLVGA